ncbi:MAG TPA: NAD(P)-binding domain-containing protein [Acidimicrobiales bacterium]
MNTEVTIVGAGPYGLSLAAYLRARAVPFRIFGMPMSFWKDSMPEGMSLKSDGHASSIYDPSGSFTLARYCSEEEIPYDDLALPVTLKTFISYGLAFQQIKVPEVEQRMITALTENTEGFSVSLDQGETFTTRKIVLATGVGYFAHVPTQFADIGAEFLTHSSQHADLSEFADQDVAIIGAGASALDLAALLNRVGARPVIIARRAAVEFHSLQPLPRTLLSHVLAPTSGIGPGWRPWLCCNAPLVFHFQSEKLRLRITKGFLGPAGGWFIKDEIVGKVPMILNSVVEEVSVEEGRVRLHLSTSDGEHSDLSVNHVIAATGFRVDVDRLTFLDESLRVRIKQVEKTPILSPHFESSVPGLFFVGSAAANSFGPVQRFAVGAKFAARRVSRHLRRARKSR